MFPPLTQRSAAGDACRVKHTTSHSVASTDILEKTDRLSLQVMFCHVVSHASRHPARGVEFMHRNVFRWH